MHINTQNTSNHLEKKEKWEISWHISAISQLLHWPKVYLHKEDKYLCILMALFQNEIMGWCRQLFLCSSASTCLGAATVFIKLFHLLGKTKKNNKKLHLSSKNRYADLDFGHICISKPLRNITGLKWETFYIFRKANSVTIVLQIMTSRNSFFLPQSMTQDEGQSL